MDFSTIDTKADAERGADLHLCHPALGHGLYTGPGADKYGRWADQSKEAEPVILRIRGSESESARKAAKALQAGAMKSAKAAESDPIALASTFVIGISGAKRGDEDLTTSPEDLRYLFSRSEDFAVQVFHFAGNASNFFVET